jgi:hypothetical protein
MRFFRYLLAFFLFLPVCAECKPRVVINADPGNNTDDILALALALVSPELDVAGVIVSGTPLGEKARMACQIEYLTGRSDVGVFIGEATGAVAAPTGNLLRYSADFGNLRPESKSGTDFLRDLLEQSEKRVTIISIAPLSTIGRLYESYPTIATKIDRVLWCHGNPEPWEYYRRDPAAARVVMASCERVVVLDPAGAREALWTQANQDRLTATALPLAEGFREMEVLSRFRDTGRIPNTALVAFAADPGLADRSRPDPTISAWPVKVPEDSNVYRLEGLSNARLIECVESTLTDRRLAVFYNLNTALRCLEELSPALAASLEDEAVKIRKTVQGLTRKDQKLKDSERFEALQNIHRMLKRVEIAKSHEAARRMILSLSTASSILAEVRVVFDPRYYEEGCFPGILGDKARITVGIRNSGPFELGRSKILVTDWTKKNRKSESFLQIGPGGTERTMDLSFPVPLEDEFDRLRRVHLIAEYQIESGWTTLLRSAWVRVVPPFTMRLQAPPDERSVFVEVAPNVAESEITLRAAPTHGDWSVENPNRTLSLKRPTGMEFVPIVPAQPSYFSPVPPFLVQFALPPLERDDFNRLSIVGRFGTYETTLEVVVPIPGANVVWLSQTQGKPVPVMQVGGRWALVADSASGWPFISYNVVDTYLLGKEADAWVEVEYYDPGGRPNALAIQYDSTLPGEKGILLEAPRILKTGMPGWHRCVFLLQKAYFGNRQPGGADFRIWDCGDGGEFIGPVRVFLAR